MFSFFSRTAQVLMELRGHSEDVDCGATELYCIEREVFG